MRLNPIVPCLWFDTQAEEAAELYTSIFPNSRILHTTRYGETGQEIHQKPVGSVLTVSFELNGQEFVALNGGPIFQFSEAVSFQVLCETQEEIDHFWERLSEGGDPRAQQCGWLKDRFGVSWQVVPAELSEWVRDHTSPKCARVMAALFGMQKLDMAALQRAHEGSRSGKS